MTEPADGKLAVVSLAGRFPGAPDAATLWRNVLAGRVSLERFAPEQLLAAGVTSAELAQPGYVPVKGVVADARRFDAHLFGYSPAEAAAIDPQQRVFLECALEALERAACDPRRFRGRIGVYAGQFISTYLLRYLTARPDVTAQLGVATVFQGNTVDQLATRAAYKLDLRGPAVTVQSACSTSLVAVHLACQALLAFECDLALAGGVTLTFPERAGYVFSEGGIVSPDGHCRPFDAAANGTVFSDGVGVVGLRRLADALADGDPIRAVVLSTALTNDGSDKVAYSAPSASAQARVVAEALAIAGVDPGSIGYVQTHGTGTPLGDPIEIEALRRAYAGVDGGREVCLGAVKANIGHLDAAAGVAGLITAVQALESATVPPIAGLSVPNPALPLAGTPFTLPTCARPWPQTDQPRRAAVSAFGVGGTNAHVVLEQAPAPAAYAGARPAYLFPVSAKTPGALRAACAALADAVAGGGTPAACVQATLALGRRQMEWRTAVAARSSADAAAALRDAPAGTAAALREIVFLFPGQGSLGDGLDRTLYDGEPLVRAAFDEASSYLAARHAIDVAAPLFGRDADRLRRTEIAQPATFALGYALARWLIALGVEPAAMIGHSVGEYVAAVLADVLSLEDALDVIVARAALMAAQPGGAMLALPLAAADVAPRLSDGVELAADNGPRAVVVAGPVAAVERFERRLARDGIAGTRLATSHAFHTAAMDPVLEPFGTVLRGVTLRPPRRPIVSTLDGRAAGAELASPERWVRQVREPVLFRQAVEAVAGRDAVFVEVGAGGQLAGLARRAEAADRTTVALVEADRSSGSHFTALRGLGRLWSLGADLAWDRLADARAPRAELPPHPLEGGVHFYDVAAPGGAAPPLDEAFPTRDDQVATWLSAPVFVPVLGRPPRRLGEKRRRWLLYVAGPDDHAELADYLESRGQVVTRVCPGESYRRAARGLYEMRLDDGDDTLALMRDLRALVRTPNVVLHLLGISAGDDEPAARRRLLGPFVALAQAVAAENTATEVRLGVVTSGAFDVLGTDAIVPAAAALSGPATVLAQELPAFVVRHVDLDEPVLRSAEFERVLELVLGDDARIALRGPRAYRPQLAPVPVDLGAPTAFRPGGLYAIVGGLGGMGLAFAERLVREHGATVLALGRRPVDDRTSARLGELADGAAGRVVPVRADVTDTAALVAELGLARRSFGPLRGVIHAAGVAGGTLMAGDTVAAAEAVLAAKTDGVRSLERALAQLDLAGELDFVLLCSSTAALVGGPGQWSYAAANAYLAAFGARRNRVGGTRWVTVDWDTFDAGMARRDAGASPVLRELRERHAIGAREGGLALEYALACGEPRVVVSRFAIDRLDVAADVLARLARSGAEKHARPALERPYAEPHGELEARVAAVWSDVLGTERPGVHDSFIELGGNSLLAAQVVVALRRAFDVDLPISLLFEKDSIAQVAADIEARILAELDEARS